MTNKKNMIIPLLLLLLTLTLLPTTIASPDLSKNTTVEMNGIKFDVPITNNNTTNEYKTDQGSNWAYEDYQNNISVYVSDERPPEYSTTEQFDSHTGTISQLTTINGKWIVVCADDFDAKDFVWNSLRA